MSHNKSICIVGPQGCGKTLQAPALVKHFGLKRWQELDELIGRPLYGRNGPVVERTGVLYITHEEDEARRFGFARRILPFNQAMDLMKAGKQF